MGDHIWKIMNLAFDLSANRSCCNKNLMPLSLCGMRDIQNYLKTLKEKDLDEFETIFPLEKWFLRAIDISWSGAKIQV
ncbi:MAG: hypothetical protein ACD_3C00205G0018 [uncultured bacterium (gcode 4)]|uniref:Uncharacterized protein n=1 Tax=uncultured bacterium (gcode 4) TaxID=1234023 RepID=K2GVU4_9BACT|nr:MAG: hypothetical protein ACD_3C00205G0018 [uncultured bacterium (gcode 4)]